MSDRYPGSIYHDPDRCECAEILYDGGGTCPKHDAKLGHGH